MILRSPSCSGSSSSASTAPRIRRVFLRLVLFVGLFASSTHGWEWSDWVGGGGGSGGGVASLLMGSNGTNNEEWNFLSLEQVSDLRVRDIKRRLARQHGYSAEELGKMILKKELVECLAFEEEKVRLRYEADLKRRILKRGIVLAVIAVVVVLCWPLIQQGYEVAMINFVVYTDRKTLEATKCWELKTKWGMLGVTLMFIIDLLQLWLTISILLSWVMPRSKYFFPTPNITIKPAQLMGGPMAQTFGGYGVNIGSMLVTWVLRFSHSQLEWWTGKVLSHALNSRKSKKKKKKSSSNEEENDGDDNDDVQKAERQTRREARRQARQAAAAEAAAPPPPDLPPKWMENTASAATDEAASGIPTSREHDEFMQQLLQTQEEESSGGLDELD